MSRNRLAVSSLPDFIAFAETIGWVSEPPKGDYEVARLRSSGGLFKRLATIWRRDSNSAGTTLTHLTMDRNAETLFNHWLKNRNQ